MVSCCSWVWCIFLSLVLACGAADLSIQKLTVWTPIWASMFSSSGRLQGMPAMAVMLAASKALIVWSAICHTGKASLVTREHLAASSFIVPFGFGQLSGITTWSNPLVACTIPLPNLTIASFLSSALSAGLNVFDLVASNTSEPLCRQASHCLELTIRSKLPVSNTQLRACGGSPTAKGPTITAFSMFLSCCRTGERWRCSSFPSFPAALGLADMTAGEMAPWPTGCSTSREASF
mmetsp:Transcript_36468/g.91144  ORF Transcript_36468/g.91144 Transcript_36468/m.91144 type:complete len:235 (+) Transcript_36468:1255-1959(+)